MSNLLELEDENENETTLNRKIMNHNYELYIFSG